MSAELILRDVEVEGVSALDVRLRDGQIGEIGRGLRGAHELDGRGGALIPGLIDHHIHLLATAAQADSVDLSAAQNAQEVAAAIAAAATSRPAGAWIRAVGYHERMAGPLSRVELDRLAPRHLLRVQHQTGSLWILNSLALEAVVSGELPDAVEQDPSGPTGRIWRGDPWLRERIGPQLPPLAPLGARLATWGVTGLTDPSVTTDESAASVLAAAHRAGDLPQALHLMSAGPLAAPADQAFAVGPVKVLLDDHALPEFDDMLGRIAGARAQGRAVAVHCVTAGELAVTLAAFETAGALAGDRIEHGGLIPPEAIAQVKALGLTVVTQSAFVFERGDRYLAEVPADEQADLYRCASLLAAGVPVAGSSDAPYASPDPWAGMQAAVRRTTRGGAPIGQGEAISPALALALYLGGFADPGGPSRRVAPGQAADLCLLKAPLADALDALDGDMVAATVVGGRLVHQN